MKRLKNLNLPIKIVISVSILFALFFRIDKTTEHFWDDFTQYFHASAWLYATLFILIQMVLLSLRWQYLLNIGKKHLNFMDALHVNLTSQLANLIFITSVGGILVRIALSVQHGATIFKSLIATVFDRLMTLSALLVFSTLFLPNLSGYVDSNTFSTLSIYISVFILTMFIFAPLFLNLVVFRMPQIARLKGRMRYGLRYLKTLINNPILCGKLIITSLTAQLCFFAAVYMLVLSNDLPLTFMQLMVVLPIISLIAALPISIGGWGVREGAYVFFLAKLGVPMDAALLISIQVGLIGMLATVLAGMPSLLASNFEIGNTSSIKEKLLRVRISR